MNTKQTRRQRRGRHPASDSPLAQLPWRHVRNPLPPMKYISDDAVAIIHEKALQVLEELGIRFLDEPALQLLKAVGADVSPNDTLVRFDRALIEEYVKKAPSQFTVRARNPAHNLIMGENVMNFMMVASTPHVSALDLPREAGTFATYTDLIKLAQSLNIVHLIGGYPVEPTDLPPLTRHLQSLQIMLQYTDKVGYAYALGAERIRDALHMHAIVHQCTIEELKQQPYFLTTVNANSPRQFDTPMLMGLAEMARHNQPVSVTPFTLSGAMAPATIPGALVQQHAEALAGIAYIQMVNPGAPAIYGGFTSNVDMKSGAPAFGTPEQAKAIIISGQLARHVGVPYRASNVNASNAPDAQAAYESQMTLWPCMLSHCNMMKHGLGWIEGGLCTSFEKVIIDAEMLQMMSEFLLPLEFSDDTLAFDAIREVTPGGHYFGTAHTMERFEKAFYSPMLSDWRNFERWQEEGSEDATLRAHKISKRLLNEWQEPALDESIKESLDAFVRKRTEEGGISDWV